MNPEEQRDRLLEALTEWSKRFEDEMPDDQDRELLEVWFDVCQEIVDDPA